MVIVVFIFISLCNVNLKNATELFRYQIGIHPLGKGGVIGKSIAAAGGKTRQHWVACIGYSLRAMPMQATQCCSAREQVQAKWWHVMVRTKTA
jgi:hypothetical protein